MKADLTRSCRDSGDTGSVEYALRAQSLLDGNIFAESITSLVVVLLGRLFLPGMIDSRALSDTVVVAFPDDVRVRRQRQNAFDGFPISVKSNN